jgi:hypothetical protein
MKPAGTSAGDDRCAGEFPERLAEFLQGFGFGFFCDAASIDDDKFV